MAMPQEFQYVSIDDWGSEDEKKLIRPTLMCINISIYIMGGEWIYDLRVSDEFGDTSLSRDE